MSAGEALRRAVRRAVVRTRGLAVAGVILAVLAAVPATLLLAWAAGGWTWRSGPIVLLGAGTAIAVALAAGLTRRWVKSVTDHALARSAERAQGLPDGTLRGVLELGRDLPPGVSAALFRRTEVEVAAGLTASPRGLAGELGRRVRRRSAGTFAGATVLTLLAVAVGLASPDRARAAWAPLLRPVAHLEGPTLPPLTVAPGDTAVDRGAVLAVRVRAPARTAVDVRWQAVGSVPGRETLEVDEGAAGASLGPIEAPTRYWVEAPDGAATDTFRVEPRDPLLVAELRVDVVYPDHTGLGADHYGADVPPLRVPQGTVLRVEGRATRALDAVALVGPDGGARSAVVAGRSFRLEWRPSVYADGAWTFQVRGRDGEIAPARPLALTVLPDEPPDVRVVVPGIDTLMPASQRQPIVADATDDWGVSAGSLVIRRRGAMDSTVVDLASSTPSPRSLLRGLLDASRMNLAPGDAVEYYVAATDNSPRGQTGRSPTFLLRVPDRRELRHRARREAADALTEARRLADRSRELEADTRDLSRSARGERDDDRQGREAPGDGRPDRLSFEAAAEAERVLEEQERTLAEAAALQERLAELERAVAEAGLEDPELRRQLDELRALYERVATPELRQAVEELRTAVERLDPAEVRAALERLAEDQTAFRRQVEESLELMRRAAAEQELNALARETEEVAARQEALNAAFEEAGQETAESTGSEPADGAAQQASLARRTGALSAALDSLRARLEALDESEGARAVAEATDRTRTAHREMTGATRAAEARDADAAVRSGEAAAGELRAAAEAMDTGRERMSRARAAQARAAIRQAAGDALELAEGEERVRRELGDRPGLASEARRRLQADQAALEEGLEQIGRNLSDTRRSALLDPAVAQALEDARTSMEQTRARLGEPGGRAAVGAAADAVDRLNQLALSLLENDGRLQEGEGGGQQALERLSEVAREQGALNGEAGALGAMSLAREALQRRLEELARRQSELADRVGGANDQLGGRTDVLGDLEALAEEAEAIAGELAQGRLDPELRARQERLFHRLLDAGRSLRRDEESDERVAERPGTVAGEAPAELDPALMDAGLRYPVPTPEQLRGLPPAYRTLVLEYFDRLNRTPPQGGGGR